MSPSDELVWRALSGDPRALSRLATLLENDSESARALRAPLYPRAGKAHVIGVTGAPGAGKSSLLAGLAQEISRQGKRIAVIAVDPTSPRTGGATLGDRIRMTAPALDPNVYIRSMASRARGDGLAPALADLILLFDAVGYDYVAIETVGAGQDQLEIVDLVHTTILVLIPGAGDSVQMLKAGSMEIADIYVVNKSDLPGAQRVSRDLRAIVGMVHGDANAWDAPIVLTSAESESGFDDLLEAIDGHYAWLEHNELLPQRARRIARSELKRAVSRMTRLDAPDRSIAVGELVDRIAGREIEPEAAARGFLLALAQELAER